MSMMWLLSIWDRFELFFLDLDILALGEFVAAGFLAAFDDVTGLASTICCFSRFAGFLVDHVERVLSTLVEAGIKQDRTRHQGKFQGAFPIGARQGHSVSPNRYTFRQIQRRRVRELQR